MLPITAIFAAVLALVYLVLTARVIAQRDKSKIPLGTGEDSEMLRRVRAHGNFAEYTPIALILLAITELQAWPTWALLLVGLALLIGRSLHAYALSADNAPLVFRVVGMVSTLSVIGIMAIGLLVGALF